jgi:TfoX/Sxy family transcriptional regulator of competence genes
MASDQRFADHVIDQLRGAGQVEARKMFGEYGIYCDDRIVALLCDNQLYVKPTAGGRAFVGDPVERPPYPGAKPHFQVTEQLDDRDWLVELVRITIQELPAPKPKKRGAKASKPKKTAAKRTTLKKTAVKRKAARPTKGSAPKKRRRPT